MADFNRGREIYESLSESDKRLIREGELPSGMSRADFKNAVAWVQLIDDPRKAFEEAYPDGPGYDYLGALRAIGNFLRDTKAANLLEFFGFDIAETPLPADVQETIAALEAFRGTAPEVYEGPAPMPAGTTTTIPPSASSAVIPPLSSSSAPAPVGTTTTIPPSTGGGTVPVSPSTAIPTSTGTTIPPGGDVGAPAPPVSEPAIPRDDAESRLRPPFEQGYRAPADDGDGGDGDDGGDGGDGGDGDDGDDGDGGLDTGGLARATHEEVVEAMRGLFGARAAFWNLDANRLQIGVDRNGYPVDPSSDEAIRVQHLLDYLVSKKITDETRILAAVEVTPWYTNASMREFDTKYGGLDNFLGLNSENQLDELGDLYDVVAEGFEKLGISVPEDRIIEIAASIDYLGYDMDNDEIYTRVMKEAESATYQFDAEMTEFTTFAAGRDSLQALARTYYVRLPTDMAANYAKKLFVGEMSTEQVEEIFRQQASARYTEDSRIQNALDAGLTLQEYFAPYQGELERELGRPVDLFEEYPDVLEQLGTDGSVRPMTFAEMRRFARQQPEWADSQRGQNAAAELVTDMTDFFGMTA